MIWILRSGLLLFFGILFLLAELSAQTLDTLKISEVEVYEDRLAPLFMQSYAIDSVTMIRYQRANLGEMLGMMSDLMLRSYGPGGIALISFRGTSPSHTRVVWNGQNLNSPLTGQVDFSLLPVEFADQITVKPGAASMQDQAGGLGGLVAIRNRVDWVDSTRVSFAAEYGSFGLSHKNIDFQKRFGKSQWRTRYARREARNDFTFFNTAVLPHQLDTMINAHVHSQFLNNEWYYRIDKKNMLSFIQLLSYTDRELPPLMSRFDNPEFVQDFYHEELHDWLVNQLVRWEHYFKHARLLVQSGFLYRNNSYFLQTRNEQQELISSIASRNMSSGFFQQASLRGEYGASKFGIGAEFNVHQASIYDLVNNRKVSPSRNEFNWFGDYYYTFDSQWQFFSILRSEKRGQYTLPFMPTVGFTYFPIPGKDANVKFSTAYNARIPDLNDLYYQPGGNPDLQPEKAYQTEIVGEYPLWNGNLILKSSAYYSTIQNWILWLNTDFGYWTPINLDRVKARGFETGFQFHYQLGKIYSQLNVRYNYTSTVYDGNESKGALVKGEQLIYIPLHAYQATAALNYQHWFIDIIHAYTGKRNTAQTGNATEIYYAIPMQAFSLVDAHIGRKWKFSGQSITGGFKVNNLLSSTYQLLPFRPMPGRNFNVYLQWRLGS